MKNKYIIQFFCYSPKIYSAFDKFNIELAKRVKEENYTSVFVYSDAVDLIELNNDLITNEIKVEIISTKNKLNVAFAILKLFVKYKPILVHSHFVNAVHLITAVYSKIFQSHYFITFHSLISESSATEYKQHKGPLRFFALKSFYKFLLACSEKFLCVSDSIEQQFKDFSGSCSPKIRRVYLGIEKSNLLMTKLELRKKFHLPENTLLIVNISAIEPIKGIDILLKAIQKLKEDNTIPNFKVYHIGGLRNLQDTVNNNYKLYLESLVIELAISNEFSWLGKRNDINELLQAFDIYVHPSRMEGIGMSLMEAAAASLPLIGSNIGGIPEVVKDGENGLLFNIQSIDELTACLFNLITDIRLREKMGMQSSKIYESSFNRDKQVLQLKSIYLAHEI